MSELTLSESHDRLVEENERLSVIASDRESAVKLMRNSWRHIADTDSNLITRYVEMAERQFKAKDGEIERLTDIATQKAARCDELYKSLEKVLDINAMPSEHKKAREDASKLMARIKGESDECI